jgi:hypothetical protein
MQTLTEQQVETIIEALKIAENQCYEIHKNYVSTIGSFAKEKTMDAMLDKGAEYFDLRFYLKNLPITITKKQTSCKH